MSKTTVDSKIEDELIDLLEENGVLSLDGEVRYKTRAAVREALEPLQNHTGSTMQEAITIVKRKILSLTRPAPTIDELSEYVQDIIDEDNN